MAIRQDKQLDMFFRPKTVAVIGASTHPRKVGHVIFRNFAEGPFRGKVFPVNPNACELFGHRCHRSILDIKERVDLAVIAIPAKFVPRALVECGRKKVKAVIIVTSGFKEIGNMVLEKKVETILKKHGMRAIGVNCLGVFDPYSGVDTMFLPSYKLERPGKGDIAFITQSGAVGSVVLDWMAMMGYRISKFISYGNATDINERELVDYLANDPKTKAICIYIEGVKEGRRFYEIAKRHADRKPIIILKGGITEQGSKAVSSHTGSLAGAREIYATAFRQAGMIQADDIEQVFDYARVLSTQPRPKGKRVQIITDGGGFGILATDWSVNYGLELAQMKNKTVSKLMKQFSSYTIVKNPIDLTGAASTEDYRIAINAALADPGVDILMVVVLFQVPMLTPDVVEVLIEANKKKKKPMIVVAAGGRYSAVLKKPLEDAGIPTFSYPGRAAQALRALYDYGR